MNESIFKANPNNKLLMIFVLLLVVIKPALDFIGGHLDLGGNNYLSLMEQILLIFILCFSVIKVGKVGLSQIGIDAWKNWDAKNKRIFLIVTPILLLTFSLIFITNIKLLINHSGYFGIGSVIFLRVFLYGFYQELLYRGILLSELVKRWGFWFGTITSNLVFTFGPEHIHFYSSTHIGFAFMFCLGLLFSIIFYRFKNLVSVGIWHGIGNIFIDGFRILFQMI